MFSMNLKSFLVDIVNTKSLKIFKLFYSHDGEFSGREIAIHTKLNPIVCLKELEKLVSARLLQKKRVGASYLFSRNCSGSPGFSVTTHTPRYLNLGAYVFGSSGFPLTASCTPRYLSLSLGTYESRSPGYPITACIPSFLSLGT